MIRSRLSNVMIAVFGVTLACYGVVALGLTIKKEGVAFVQFTYVNIVNLVLLGLGLWCITGAVRNMKVPSAPIEQEQEKPVFTYKLAKWNLLLVAITVATTMASYLLRLALVFWVSYYLLLLAFISVFAVLTAHAVLLGKTRS